MSTGSALPDDTWHLPTRTYGSAGPLVIVLHGGPAAAGCAAGAYPAAFAAIVSPVLMLHGTYDPHPGAMIRDSLLPYLPQIEYREWERCGHSPWRERHARDEFLTVLKRWLGLPG